MAKERSGSRLPPGQYETAKWPVLHYGSVPKIDPADGDALFAFGHDGRSLTAEHGAPCRLVIPRLYFWKSAKWVRGMTLMRENRPGF